MISKKDLTINKKALKQPPEKKLSILQATEFIFAIAFLLSMCLLLASSFLKTLL